MLLSGLVGALGALLEGERVELGTGASDGGSPLGRSGRSLGAAVSPHRAFDSVPAMQAPRFAVAAIVVILAACGGSPAASPSLSEIASGTASPSELAQSASPSSEPSSSPVPLAVEVDSLVETVVDDLSVRREPGLSAARVGIAPAGLRAWVIDGPVEADGYRWFLLTGAPPDPGDGTSCGEPPDLSCASWIGWAAGAPLSGDAWLRTAAVDCPVARDVAAYLSLTPDERLFCAADDGWRLRVYVPPLAGGRGCLPVWVTDPGWMTGECTFTFPQAEKRQLDEDTSLQMFTPPALNTCGQPGVCWWEEHNGQWVIVTGHLDDPVARTCRPVLSGAFEEDIGPPPDTDLVVHQCRLHFVVRSVSETVATH